jgi:hypothetical protein
MWTISVCPTVISSVNVMGKRQKYLVPVRHFDVMLNRLLDVSAFDDCDVFHSNLLTMRNTKKLILRQFEVECTYLLTLFKGVKIFDA